MKSKIYYKSIIYIGTLIDSLTFELEIMKNSIKIIECPRDAMQGFPRIISTEEKIDYMKSLLEVGFDILDFGSFVSAKAIPQMKDTSLVAEAIMNFKKDTKLLAIVANERGAQESVAFPHIDYLGYPFSISESFQLRNTNSTIEESIHRVDDILKITKESGKELIIYISMAFGNPYGDIWNAEIVNKYVEILSSKGIRIIALSDTIGVANPESIRYIFSSVIDSNPSLEIGAHFHTTADSWEEKLVAAFESGCTRFDGAIKGLGGCPMAKDELVGNMPTEKLLEFCIKRELPINIDKSKFWESYKKSESIFF